MNSFALSGRINLHTHTSRCKHATGAPVDYCREAVKQGVTTLGFSDHVAFPNRRYGGTRMLVEEFPAYRADIAAAQKAFPGLRVLAGFELEYEPDSLGWYREQMDALKLDYCIGGVHAAYDSSGVLHGMGECGSFDVTRWFVESNIRFLSTGLIRYLAHPDIAAFAAGPWNSEYAALFSDLCRASVDLDIPLEINAYGLRKMKVERPAPEGIRAPYPWLPFWELAATFGVKCVVGADAHRPEDVWGNTDDALAIAKTFGLKVMNAEVAAAIPGA